MKFIKYLILAAAMIVPCVSQAQSGQSLGFLNGFNLAIGNNATNTYNTTNTYGIRYSVTNSGTYPYVSSYSGVYVTNAAWAQDVTLWADRDGSAPNVSISVDINGLNAAFTNLVTFYFNTIPAFPPAFGLLNVSNVVSTAAQNAFSFVVTGNGTTDVVLATNVPTSVLQGARGIRLTAISETGIGSQNGTNGTVVGVFLNGYKPAGAE